MPSEHVRETSMAYTALTALRLRVIQAASVNVLLHVKTAQTRFNWRQGGRYTDQSRSMARELERRAVASKEVMVVAFWILEQENK